MIEDQAKPWEKRQDESNKAFAAFCVYRDMGPSRSIAKAYAEIQRQQNSSKKTVPRHWFQWSIDFEWPKRTQEYDLHLELIARQDREAAHHKELEEFRDRQKKLAQTTQESAQRVLELSNLKLNDLLTNYEDWKQAVAKEEDPLRRAELLAHDPISNVKLPAWLRAAAQVAQVATDAESQALAVNELLHVLETNNQ